MTKGQYILSFESKHKNADEPIRDQVIDKYRSSEIRQTLLTKETDLTIAKLQEISRSFETIDIQLHRTSKLRLS